MLEKSENTLSCGECGGNVRPADDFCPGCGGIFKNHMMCCNHSRAEADGVCLICRKPYCAECGSTIGKVFLCRKHSTLEIYEHGASVFRSPDLRLGQIAFQVLTERGYHPFFVPRAIVPVTNIGRLTPNQSVGPHLVIVPFEEYTEAEKVLKKLEIIE